MDAVVEATGTGIARSELYGLLARALASPEGAVDAVLLRDFVRVAAETASYKALAPPMEDLLARIEAAPPSPRVVLQEFTRLFHTAKSSPYEASYVPGIRTAQEIADVAAFSRAFGLQTRGERADHIVSELELMSVLCLKEALATGNGRHGLADVCRDAEAKFLRDHLGRWLGIYRAGVEREAATDLYPTLVRLTDELVRIDARAFGIEPETIEEVPRPESETIPGCGVTR
ncbi:MAG: hypothetical protein A3K68_06880 [Euryarchaeota archaeon RBG_16_68_13]|nr:MAG: hypothetical protein A3K68_06880 [Euryarchaeota archaeon RBG_16_68_13]